MAMTDAMLAGLVLSWLLIIVLSLAMGALLRRVQILESAVLAQTDPELGPSLGSIIVNTSLPAPALLLFVDDECNNCKSILPDFESLTGHFQRGLVVRGDSKALLKDEPHSYEVLDKNGHLFETLRVLVTPFLIGVRADRQIVLAEPVGSRPRLKELADIAINRMQEERDVVAG